MTSTMIRDEIERPDGELLRRASAFPTATVHEAAGQRGALPSAIKPLAPRLRLCGPAVTVQSPPVDNLWLHRAIYVARPGDVLVVDVSAHYEAGYWGEIMSQAAVARGLGGLVIDGCVRDGARLLELALPVFARGLCIRGTSKNRDGVGSINQPVRVGDVIVFPGDLVLGDGDGVVVVPRADVAETLAKAQAREEKEADVIRQLQAGGSTLEIYGLSG